MQTIPTYDELGGEGLPPGANWGVFGPNDELGTLNFINSRSARDAARLVKTGETFVLGLSQSFFDPPLTAGRRSATHFMTAGAMGADDKYDEFYPQASSQWDALRHYRHPKFGHYNGIPPESIEPDGDMLSISRLARKGIVARGVLADVARYRERQGRPVDCSTDEVLSLADLQGCLADEGLALEEGTILLVRTGWLTYYRKHGSGGRHGRDLRVPGLANGTDIAAFLWNHRVAAVAGDNLAVEASPGPGGRSLHVQLLVYLGMPLGELWDLDSLAEGCARDGVFEFMLCSAPNDLPGGCGSPANALAVK